MINLLSKIITTTPKQYILAKIRFVENISVRRLITMASEMKNSNSEENPAKRLKLTKHISDDSVVQKRTVGTMCGAWRPEEEYGGMILVFQKRKLCISPDPTKESDFPENIKDVWVSSPEDINNDQVSVCIFL